MANKNSVVTVGDWIITFIILCIPIVNIIALIVWLVSDNVSQSKKNFFIASLIIFVISVVLSVLGFIFIWASILSMLESVQDSAGTISIITK